MIEAVGKPARGDVIAGVATAPRRGIRRQSGFLRTESFLSRPEFSGREPRPVWPSLPASATRPAPSSAKACSSVPLPIPSHRQKTSVELQGHGGPVVITDAAGPLPGTRRSAAWGVPSRCFWCGKLDLARMAESVADLSRGIHGRSRPLGGALPHRQLLQGGPGSVRPPDLTCACWLRRRWISRTRMWTSVGRRPSQADRGGSRRTAGHPGSGASG